MNVIEFLVLFGLCSLAFMALTGIGLKADLTSIIAGTALYRAVDLGRKNDRV